MINVLLLKVVLEKSDAFMSFRLELDTIEQRAWVSCVTKVPWLVNYDLRIASPRTQ